MITTRIEKAECGYHVEVITADGKTKKLISLPGSKKVRLLKWEKLLVINGEPKFFFETAGMSLLPFGGTLWLRGCRYSP